MKIAKRIFFPALSFINSIYAVVESTLGYARDMAKGVYLALIQIHTRLAYVERELPSSLSLKARLDVIPRSPMHERHRLALGRDSLIESSCVVCTWHGDVVLKEGASVGIGSILIGPVQMGEGSACAQNCFIGGQSHRYEDVSKNFLRQGSNIKEVVIRENVWIGANAVIVPGVEIGSHSVIGAGSVVTKDIPCYSVAVGNPARVIKKYDSQSKEWIRV